MRMAAPAPAAWAASVGWVRGLGPVGAGLVTAGGSPCGHVDDDTRAAPPGRREVELTGAR